MDLDDYPLLNEPNVMLVALRVASPGPAAPTDCLNRLARSLAQARIGLPPETGALRERIALYYRYLHIAGLVERDAAGRFRATARGEETLRRHPQGIDSSVLVKFPEFRAFVRRPRDRDRADTAANKAHAEGYIAALSGADLAENPYSADHSAHLEWENGWSEALDEEQPVYEHEGLHTGSWRTGE